MFILCIAGGIRNAGGYVWAYNTEIFFETFYTKETINRFMSWIPLVGGSLGAVAGGVISDLLVKGHGTLARIWVLVVSQVIMGRGNYVVTKVIRRKWGGGKIVKKGSGEEENISLESCM